MKKISEFEIGVIVFMIMISLMFFGIYLIVEVYYSNRSYVLFLKPYTILDCRSYECKNVTDKLDDYNNKDYGIYVGGEDLGVNKLFYNTQNEKFYVFDKINDNLYKERYDNLLGYSGNVVQVKYEENKEISDSEIDELSKEMGFSVKVEYVSKISLDFDNDTDKESIYLLNHYGTDGEISNEDYYSALVYRDNNKYYVVSKNVSSNFIDIPYVSIFNILDIFDDKKLEFVLTNTYYDNIGYCSQLYRLKGRKFVSVNECEIVG